MSNLLQKASIVTTPTAYGVGVLNSIKPAIPFGEELISNGSFNNGSTGWTIINGTVTDKYNASMTAYQSGIRIVPFSYTGTFKVVFDLVITSGNCKFDAGGGNDEIYTTSGTKEKIITNPTKFEFNAFNLGWVGTLDNVSVKEMIDADFDFTRTSSATRVNPDYLLETVSINGSELVQNGNFSELGSQLITNGNFETDSNWIKQSSWTISNGSANYDFSTNSKYLRQTLLNGGFVSGETYKINFEITKGTAYMNIKSNAETLESTALYSIGSYSIYVTASANGSDLLIYGLNTQGTAFSIDNVSVKQVDPNDNWDLDTGWSYGTNKAIKSTTATSSSFCSQDLPLVNNSLYKIQFDLNITSATTTSIGISNSGAFGQLSSSERFYTTSGTKTITALFDNSKPTQIKFVGGDNTSFELENVSIIEIQQNGVPRLDYTNGTASILLEPQSTNLLTYSNDFSQWGNARTTDTANQITSPDGLNDGTLLEQQSGQTNAGSIYFSVSLSSGTYTQSLYAKKKDKNYIVAYDANANRTYFNLEEGCIKTVASGVTADMIAMPNGWYRCIITYTITTGAVIAFYLADNDNSTTVTDSGGVYIYGAQLEQQSFSTSLIHTSGSTVTRAAETLNNAGNSDLINSTEGVLYADIAALANDGTNRAISISDGTTSNVVRFYYSATDNRIVGNVKSGGSSVFTFNNVLSNAVDFIKLAIKYKANDFKMYVNGIEVSTDTSGVAPVGLKELAFDNGAGNDEFYGKTKTVAVFKEALSDTELACLTSTNNREIFLNYYYRMQYVEANTEALSCAEKTFNI